ncbi:MAG: riboflavin biosynthesis protein RibF [Clostridiales bacterium]
MVVLDEKNKIADFAAAHELHVALGYFDGLHLGHQTLLDYVLQAAGEKGGQAGVLLIEPHPLKILRGNGGIRNLNTLEDKIRLIQAYGDIHVFILPFDREFAGLSPEAFVRDYLAGLLQIRTAACGFNYSFGKGGAGKSETLCRLGEIYGFSCGILPKITYKGKTVSSTEIRRFIEKGHMKEACSLLGHSHIYTGKVIGGNKLGTRLGFPTANLELNQELTWPAYGVYGGFVQEEDGSIHRAVINAGIRPTVKQEDKKPSFEANLINFSGDLYGKTLRVALTDRLRPEKTFADLDGLRRQIAIDEKYAIEALNSWQADLEKKYKTIETIFSYDKDFYHHLPVPR